ncbi:MAG: peroxiredoxin [Ectothiorhodospiraceae bacterium]|nr:peroxiredoxin [Ectothiorhodospiraceae bacterium]
MLKTQTKAPDFTLKKDDGEPIRLSSLRGSKVILAFYPKDLSPVCTKQMKNYADRYDAFLENGVHIIGVSADDVASHAKFKSSCGLPFPLLSDPDKHVCRLYDVLSFFGTIQRTVYIIDEDGIIQFAGSTMAMFYPSADELLKLL